MEAPVAYAWYLLCRGGSGDSKTFYGMKVGQFLAEINLFLLKMCISQLKIVRFLTHKKFWNPQNLL